MSIGIACAEQGCLIAVRKKLYKIYREEKVQMEKKLNIALLIISLFLLSALSVSLVSAGVFTATLNLPASSTIKSGTIVLNVTVTNYVSNISCDFSAKSTSTANSSWTGIVSNVYNNSEAANTINATFSTVTLEDADDYIFNATCRNGTAFSSVTNTAIRLDNSRPLTPSSLSPTDGTIDTDGIINFSATVESNTTTQCNLNFTYINPGQPWYSATYQTVSCDKVLTLSEGTYIWYIGASDNTNWTKSAENTLIVDIKTSAGTAGLIHQLEEEGKIKITGTRTFTIVDSFFDGKLGPLPVWLIVIIVIFAIGMYWLYKRK